jgi:PPM family protein phosphatase
VFLLCSDGLTTMVLDDELGRLLGRDAPLDHVACDLIDAANRNGGMDNITVIVLEP